MVTVICRFLDAPVFYSKDVFDMDYYYWAVSPAQICAVYMRAIAIMIVDHFQDLLAAHSNHLLFCKNSHTDKSSYPVYAQNSYHLH